MGGLKTADHHWIGTAFPFGLPRADQLGTEITTYPIARYLKKWPDLVIGTFDPVPWANYPTDVTSLLR